MPTYVGIFINHIWAFKGDFYDLRLMRLFLYALPLKVHWIVIYNLFWYAETTPWKKKHNSFVFEKKKYQTLI